MGEIIIFLGLCACLLFFVTWSWQSDSHLKVKRPRRAQEARSEAERPKGDLWR